MSHRLIDDLRIEGVSTMPWWVEPRLKEKWANFAQSIWTQFIRDDQLPIILVDNVAAYYYGGTGQEYWDIGRDFPNLAPPFPVMWLESRVPATIHSTECGDTNTRAFTGKAPRVGVLLIGVPADQASMDLDPPPTTKWVLTLTSFIDYGLGNIYGPHDPSFLLIDEHGALIDRPWSQVFCDKQHNESVASLMGWYHPALLAISFLHCKNVQVTQNYTPRPLVKKFRAKHGFSPTPYKTLVIEPLKQILRTQGHADSNGIAKAMHICRGHFRDYRDGAGLFGKYKVLVWQDQIVRGTRRTEGMKPREIEVRI